MPKPLKDVEEYSDDEMVTTHISWPALNWKVLGRIAKKRKMYRQDLLTILIRNGLLATGYKDEAALWRDNPPVGNKRRSGDD